MGVPASEPRAEFGRDSQQAREQLDRLRENIQRVRKRLDAQQGKERSILGRLEALGRSIEDKQERVAELETQLKASEQEIQDKRRRLESTRKQLSQAGGRLRIAVRLHHRFRQLGWLKVLLASGGIEEITRKAEFGRRLNRYALSEMEAPARLAAQLRVETLALEDALAQSEEERSVLLEEAQSLESERSAQRRMLTAIREDTSVQAQALQEMRQTEEALLDLLGQLTGERLPSTDFARRKGELPWPVQGKVLERFGKQVDSRYQTVTVNKGISIRPGAGEVWAKAVHEGVAVFSDWFRGYGRMVVLDHGEGYFSVYAHLEQTRVGLNDSVDPGQPLGRVGQTGMVETPRLYFEIRKNGVPDDPQKWLGPPRD